MSLPKSKALFIRIYLSPFFRRTGASFDFEIRSYTMGPIDLRRHEVKSIIFTFSTILADTVNTYEVVLHR